MTRFILTAVAAVTVLALAAGDASAFGRRNRVAVCNDWNVAPVVHTQWADNTGWHDPCQHQFQFPVVQHQFPVAQPVQSFGGWQPAYSYQQSAVYHQPAFSYGTPVYRTGWSDRPFAGVPRLGESFWASRGYANQVGFEGRRPLLSLAMGLALR
jgi:hypothetical protein